MFGCVIALSSKKLKNPQLRQMNFDLTFYTEDICVIIYFLSPREANRPTSYCNRKYCYFHNSMDIMFS